MSIPDNADQPLWPSRKWWLILSFIVLCGAGLRYTGYNFSLPYLDHVDEPAYNIAGRMILDNGSAKPIGMQGYPPGIIELNYVLVRFFQKPNTPPGSVIGLARLVSITFSVLLIVLIALLGFRVAMPLAGLFAALFWAFSPQIVEFSRYATADNFITFFSVAALFLVITGTRQKRKNWLYAGSIASCFAIIFKYQAVFMLPVLLAFPLLWLFRPGVVRRRVLKYLAITSIIQIIFFSWLVFIYPASEATSSPDWSAPASRLSIPSVTILLSNFTTITTPMASSSEWLIGFAGFGLLLLWLVICKPAHHPVDLWASFALIAACLATVFGVGLYGQQGFRQFIAVAALLTILRATGLSVIVMLLGIVWEHHNRFIKALTFPTRYIGPGIAVALVLLSLIPGVNSSVVNAYQHTLPDRRNDLAVWADTTIPSGKYITQTENHKTFNWSWGGYNGKTQFPLAQVIHNFNEGNIADWRAQGVQYAIIGFGAYHDMQKTAAGQEQLAQMTLLKTFPPSLSYRGPDMAIFRLYPIQHPQVGQLGPIRLIGYDIDKTTVHSGDSVTFTMYWQAVSPADSDYTVFNHLIKANTTETVASDVVEQIDGLPLPDERRPTNTWNDPNETLMSRSFTLTISTATAPGTYSLQTGFYQRNTGKRLLAADNHSMLEVAQIVVLAK